MTKAELKFAETVPALLRRIAGAALRIADEMNKSNCLKALELGYVAKVEGVSLDEWHDAIKEIVGIGRESVKEGGE